MKMYLVINDWSNASACQVSMIDYKLFKEYKNAKEDFEEKKQRIIGFNLGYDEIEDSKDYYCESVNGEYLYQHELVYIKEVEIEDYE